MIYIAHRGLFSGPDPTMENRPEQIEQACALGFECEVDLWVLRFESHNRFYLGHDSPQYEIDIDFLTNHPLWIHAKNIYALHTLKDSGLNCFWHDKDEYTLTSLGYIWANPGSELTDKSIMVMPEYVDASLENAFNAECYGICSDYIQRIKTVRSY